MPNLKAKLESEQRTEDILYSLKKLDYLSRSQLQQLHDLGQKRNANRVLQQCSEFLSSFRDIENIYYLNKEGRDRVGSSKIRKKTPQAKHFIMRNYIYIAFECPSDWKNEVKLGIKEKKIINKCDATFTRDNKRYIVEVDNMQKMSENKKKIEKYKVIAESGVYGSPDFIWITTTTYRQKQLSDLCADLDCQVFLLSDFY
ncbi:replication-relaxation family protein [Priestia aryabhattai]